MIWLFLLPLLWITAPAYGAACPGSGVAFSCPAGTTSAEVQATITAASDGAVITFASGSYSWGDTEFYIDNAKGVTLQGAGIGNSVVTVVSPGYVCCADGHFSGLNTKLYRITGFTFQNAPDGSITFRWYGTEGAKATNVRFDHNRFADIGTGSNAIILGGFSPNSQVTGLVDHNEFSATLHNYNALKVLGKRTDSTFTTMPQTATVRGTIDNTFFEDNTIDFAIQDGFGTPCFDGWNAGSIVFRFNTVRNCQVGEHGTAHGGGLANMETYGNILIRDSGSNTSGASVEEGYRVWESHGGWESYVWNNLIQHLRTIHAQALSVTHYRSADQTEAFGTTFVPPGRCDGTQPQDGNTSPGGTYYGYPCWGNPGRAPANGSPAWGTLAPMYLWKNIDDTTGDTVPLYINSGFTGHPYSSTHVQANRDYYDAVSKDPEGTCTGTCFDGTTGMGFGPLANRPATCTHTTSPDGDDGGGVAYFATDQGSWNTSSSNPYGVNVAGADGVLYRCSATNTWTVHYTPYTYPHPLNVADAGSSSGSAITGTFGATGSVSIQ